MAPGSSSSKSSNKSNEASSSGNNTNNNATELVALVAWLQTFPSFAPIKIVDGSTGSFASDTVLDALSSLPTSRAIWKVAEEICDASAAGVTPNKGAGDFALENASHDSADDLWTNLLILTSTRSRPLQQNDSNNNTAIMSPLRLKTYVLSNLLDCGVQCVNLDQRRTYIQRIMALPKQTQKTLMSLIERRSGNKKSKAGGTPSSGGKSGTANSNSTPPKSVLRNGSKSPPRPPPGSASSAVATPPRVAHSTAKLYGLVAGTGNGNISSSSNSGSPTPPLGGSSSSNSKAWIPPPSSTPPKPGRALRRDNKNTGISSSPMTPALKRTPPQSQSQQRSTNSPSPTPEQHKHYNPRASLSSQPSPGTLENASPAQVHSLVQDLRTRNEQLQQVLETYQQREAEARTELDRSRTKHRQVMMQIEAEALDRQETAARHHQQQTADLKRQLEEAHERANANQSAIEELESTREEMDVLQHKSRVLTETTEKLRKYKEKVEQLQDCKEALSREQDAHATSVDEIVRLETELAGMQGVKRQLDEYKIRAIEAEVKLVECQDYLRRVEQKATDQATANDYLWQGAILQKEQLEEMQHRLQEEAAAGDSAGARGVGDGLSELNPQLMQEVTRLRSENEQLREFSRKRQGDNVSQLESQLDDQTALADRYKNEFLGTKNQLAETQAELHENKQRVEQLSGQVQDLTERLDEAERQGRDWHDKYAATKDELEKTECALEKAQARVRHLEDGVSDWTQKYHDSEAKASERLDRWQQAQTELDKTSHELEMATQSLAKLQEKMVGWEERNHDLEETEQQLGYQLQKSQDEVSETRVALEETRMQQIDTEKQTKRLMEQKSKLQTELEDEKKSRMLAAEEAHEALQATRAVLLAKSRKEVEEIQGNMNCLLDDERRANRRKDEEYELRIHDLNAKWKKDYEELQERLSSSLKHSREEAQGRVDYLKTEYAAELLKAKKDLDHWRKQFLDSQERSEFLQKEYKEELEKTRQETEDARGGLIQKGKAMMKELKSKAEDQLLTEQEQRRNAEQRMEAMDKEKNEVEKLLRSKINTLKSKLDASSDHIGELTRETDDQQESVKMLEREKHKLQEDNDRYRRQLGGRYGADGGKLQSQLESLQKEYNAVLQENRSLKSSRSRDHRDQLSHAETVPTMMSSISEESNDSFSHSSRGENGGGNSRSSATLTQLRNEYEEMVEALNDEKRELVMKHTAAMTDVQKAEQRAWEREQEVSRLEAELTSMRLQAARADYHSGQEVLTENRSPPDLSFFSASEELPGKGGGSPYHDPATKRSPSRSPSLDRAMKNRAEHEAALRNRITSLTGTPPRVPRTSNLDTSGHFPPSSADKALTPARRHNSIHRDNHQHQHRRSNSFSPTREESFQAKMTTSAPSSPGDVFGLRANNATASTNSTSSSSPSTSSSSITRPTYNNMPSLMDHYDERRAHAAATGQDKPECQQS